MYVLFYFASEFKMRWGRVSLSIFLWNGNYLLLEAKVRDRLNSKRHCAILQKCDFTCNTLEFPPPTIPVPCTRECRR